MTLFLIIQIITYIVSFIIINRFYMNFTREKIVYLKDVVLIIFLLLPGLNIIIYAIGSAIILISRLENINWNFKK